MEKLRAEWEAEDGCLDWEVLVKHINRILRKKSKSKKAGIMKIRFKVKK